MKIKKPFLLSIFAVLLISAAFAWVYPYRNEEGSYAKKEMEFKPKQDTIIISAVGDCTLGRDSKSSVSRSLQATVERNNNDVSYLFSNVKSIFENDDITIANLETTFTDHDLKVEKEFNFKGPSYLSEAFPLGSIEAVNLSNNHIYDFGIQGFNDTREVLKQYGVNYFGEGFKYEKNIKGIGIGFLGYRGWYLSKQLLQKLKSDISDLKTRNKIVFVNFHWGDEMETSPDTVQRRLAWYAVDFGADIVIGHHPHVIQGIEKYKDSYICYSLANFCFGGNSNPKDKDTFIFQARFIIKDSTIISSEIRALPCSISSTKRYNNYKPSILNGSEKARVLNKINARSKEFGFRINTFFGN